VVAFTGGAAGFAVRDVPAARAFYAGTLGLQVRPMALGVTPDEVTPDEVPPGEIPPGLRIELPGGSAVQVYPKPDHVPAGFTVLTLLVDDIDAAVDELAGRGVPFERYEAPKTDERGIHRDPRVHPVAWFRDPSGNIVALVERRGHGSE
jgi:catechol 2,3-dioxygenase-like lactoylglutathione lyase family enzyme